jgi:hypothetical protein
MYTERQDTMTTKEAFIRGWEDAQKGFPLIQGNPFAVKSAQWNEWRKGWIFSMGIGSE